MSKKKNQPDLFGDDTASRPQNEFEALLNGTSIQARGLAPGDRFRGEVLAVTGQEAFISTGTPTDAVMPFVPGPDGKVPKAGDQIDVIVIRVREGEILVKEVGGRGVTAEMDSLEDAFDMEIPVEGLVTESIKGGFRVKVQAQSAFCPVSQIDFRCVNPADYVGKKYEFIITKYERGRDLVVSRRRVLEQERATTEGDFLSSAQIGDIFTGTVFRIEKYGAFVRLENGLEGLVPVSELAWGRIGHPQEVVNPDQEVQVKLIRSLEEDGRLKLTFSVKQGGSVADPWATIASDYPVGTGIEGVVEHKEPFGLFVNIAKGVTGLLPRSAWRDSTEGKEYENKRRGDRVKVRVDRIDQDNRKLSFSLPRDDEDDSWRSHGSAQGSGKQTSFGSLGDLFKNLKK